MTAKTPAKKSKKGGWKKAIATPVELPSGETALCLRPGIQSFLTKGIIPDALAPIVQAQIDKAQGKKPRSGQELDMTKLMQDPAKLAAMIELVDAVLLEVVVSPRVAARPTEARDGKSVEELTQALNDQGVYFPDDVDLEDKMFIFNYAVGGTRDLERFRQGSAETLASVDSVSGVQLAP